jgi:hypothetical protein
MNVVGADGAVQDSLWALGTLVEGCKFYTFVLPRPGANSTSMVDAGRAVGGMMDAIARRNKVRRELQALEELAPPDAIEPAAPACAPDAWPQQGVARLPVNDLAVA